jgi:hypothetical protein
MNSLLSLSPAQLIRAATIKDKIIVLEKELVSILGSPAPAAKPGAAPKKKSTMSVAGRARIRAAQKLRWAKIKMSSPTTVAAKAPASTAKKKFKMSAAAKAKISAAAKARWAKVKAGKKA